VRAFTPQDKHTNESRVATQIAISVATQYTLFQCFFFFQLFKFIFLSFPDKKQKTLDKITFNIEKRHQCIVHGV